MHGPRNQAVALHLAQGLGAEDAESGGLIGIVDTTMVTSEHDTDIGASGVDGGFLRPCIARADAADRHRHRQRSHSHSGACAEPG